MVRMVTNRWQPDTCDCVIEFEFDADSSVEARVHTGTNIEKDCPEHSGLITPENFFNTILDENKRKNIIRSDLIQNISDLSELDNDGALQFKNGISMNWYWTGENDARVLHITISGYTLTTQQKTTAQTFADTKFGVGKVVID